MRNRDIYPLSERARAFLKGIPKRKPMVSVAREGLERPEMPRDRLVSYALAVAESKTCGCAEIAQLMRTLAAKGEEEQPNDDPYRSPSSPSRMAHTVQERLCRLFRERFEETMDALRRERFGAYSSGAIVEAGRLNSGIAGFKMKIGRLAYDLLKCRAITSNQARTDLTRVFCQAARDVVTKGHIHTEDSIAVHEAVIGEYNVGRLRCAVSRHNDWYDTERIISVVSERLCGENVSYLGPSR